MTEPKPDEGSHLEQSLGITEAVRRACKEPTLLDALSWICVWESERVVKQARKNSQWETCFKVCLRYVTENYPEPKPDEGLLTDEEIKDAKIGHVAILVRGKPLVYSFDRAVAKAQRDLTASEKDAECQEKIDQIVKDDADRCAGYLKMAREECSESKERIFREIEDSVWFKQPSWPKESFIEWWQALKEKELK